MVSLSCAVYTFLQLTEFPGSCGILTPTTSDPTGERKTQTSDTGPGTRTHQVVELVHASYSYVPMH